MAAGGGDESVAAATMGPFPPSPPLATTTTATAVVPSGASGASGASTATASATGEETLSMTPDSGADPASGATYPPGAEPPSVRAEVRRLVATVGRVAGLAKTAVVVLLARNFRTVRAGKSPRRARVRAAAQLVGLLGAALGVLLLLMYLMGGLSRRGGRGVPGALSGVTERGGAPATGGLWDIATRHPPALTVVAIVQRPDAGSLERLVRSLAAAEYDGDAIDLALWMDVRASPAEGAAELVAAAVAAAAAWPHGVAAVRHSTSSAGPYDTHLHAVPGTDGVAFRGQVLYVDDTTEVAPTYYTWLRDARRAYGDRSDVAGYSLESARVIRRARSSSWEPLPAEEQGSDSFLYQALPGVGAFSPQDSQDMSVWSTFTVWLTARANGWYGFPAVPPHLTQPASPFQGSNGTRAHWSAWFSVFVRDYNLYVVYPPASLEGVLAVGHRADSRRSSMLIASGATTGAAQTKALHSAALGPVSIPEAPLRWTVHGHRANGLDGSGVIVDGSPLLSLAKVDEMVATARAAGGVLSMTVVNEVFLETAHSWLCNVDGGGFRPTNVVWATTDKVSRDALSRIVDTSTVFLDEMQGGKSTGHDFGNPGYWRLMLERTALLSALVHRGVRVFAFETDQVWLEDPTPYIASRLVEGADIVGTINTRDEISGNFFYLRPTLQTRRLFDEIVRKFVSAFVDARLNKKSATSWTYIENDQSILTKLVLRNQTFQTAYPTRFETLDQERFVDGRWYVPEEGFYTSPAARQPVVINNNFIIGVEKKTLRAKQWGHWFLRDDGTCDNAVVAKAIRPKAAAAEAVARDEARAARTTTR
ncbi:hypothetical protein MMPV_004099 [Pyropia vietnamensis]